VIGPGGRKEHGLGLVLPLQPPLREDKGEGVGKGGVSECGRLLGLLEGREWMEHREWEARPKEAAAWAGKVLWVGEGEGKPDVMMRVFVDGGGRGEEFSGFRQRRRVGVWGEDPEGLGV
jgi:hypothetical protein